MKRILNKARTKQISIVLLIIIFLSSIPLFTSNEYSSEINEDEFKEIIIRYDFSKPVVNRFENTCTIDIEKLNHLYDVGNPVLPLKTVKILLPQGQTVKDIEIESGNKIYLKGSYKIEPALQPYRLDELIYETEEEINKTTYNSDKPYPGKLYEEIGIQSYRGYDILYLNLYPVEYIPKSGEISYYENMEVKVTTTTFRSADINPLFRSNIEDEKKIKNMVDNPEIVFTYTNKINQKTRALSGSWDYVIITNQSLKDYSGDNNFQDLADYRNTTGITTTIVTTEWIYSEYTGVDNAEEIRNFIIDAYTNWGIEYVLLGGDGDGADVGGESGDNIIPARGFTLNFSVPSYDEDNIPADMYYGCLDGDFNYDGDAYWAEPTDGPGGGEVDLIAEVYVGRAPVDNNTEISNFVRKTLEYQTDHNETYLETAWMVGEYLYSGPTTWGGDYKDEIKDGSDNNSYTTVGFPEEYNVSTLYERDYPGNDWPQSEIIGLINNNTHIINHMGHSDPDYNMKIYVSDVSKFNNTKYFFEYSQGCYAGSFDNRNSDGTYNDYDSIGEQFVTGENGSFAVVMNSRSGWGQKGSTNGPSQMFDREFFDAIFGEKIRGLGKANADSKEDWIGNINDYFGFIRWCYYELNLLGDPTVKLKNPDYYEHDIEVANIQIEDEIQYNKPNNIRATIENIGLNDETNIEVNFTVDSIVEDSTIITSLNSGEMTEVEFIWIPQDNGTYEIGIEATPLLYEGNTTNNEKNKTINVQGYPDIWISDDNYNEIIETGISMDVYLTIGNDGYENLDFNISTYESWLTVSTNQDTIMASLSKELTITFNASELDSGNYQMNLTIESNDPDEDVINISINLAVVDTTKPEITNVQATPNPQEVNGNVNISVTITDNYALSGIWVNILGIENYSMNYGGGDVYYYNTSYSSKGIYDFTILAYDTSNNWNSSSGQFEIDSTKPIISNVQTTPTTQEIYGYINITATVTDNYGLNIINITLNGTDHTMMYGGADVYYYNTTYDILGTYNYTIWANDTSDNLESIIGTFDIVDTTKPEIENITAEDTEVYGYINITATVTDNYALDIVNVTIDGTNHTMLNAGGDVYYYNTTYNILGRYNYTIWVNDTSDNLESISGIFDIVDTMKPKIENITAEDTEVFGYINITCNITDNYALNGVWLYIAGVGNFSMQYDITTDLWYYNNTYASIGIHTFVIFAVDSVSNWNSEIRQFEIKETTGDVTENIQDSEDGSIWLWILIVLIIIAVITGIVVYNKKRNGKPVEENMEEQS